MIKVNDKLQIQFNKMCNTGKLFRVNLTGDYLWELYINSFSIKDNPKFRDPSSSTHNCNLCNNFIRRYGNITAIDENGKLMSIFDIDIDNEFTNSFKILTKAIKLATIKDVFFETYNELNSLPYESCTKNQDVYKLGIIKNVKRYTKEEADKFGVIKPNEIRTFYHLNLNLPKQFVDNSGKSIESINAFYKDKYSVFKRTMEEISLDTLNLVKDLINQGSLLDGTAHLHSIEEIRILKQMYDGNNYNDLWLWKTSYSIEERTAKFKNTLIGVLCTELTEGMELNKACENWNKRVDPANYMKAIAPITNRQIQEAKKFVEENGYVESFNRRLATIDDIKVSEILHSNVDNDNIKSISIFDNVKSISTQHKRNEFKNVEEVSIDKFMIDILPTCTSIEAYFENRMINNLVTLTTSNSDNSKPIFKWNNNYSWTYNGNLAGKSLIKTAVKNRGGNTNGILNVRLAFPNTIADYDLHMIEPNGNHIYYNTLRSVHKSSGILDLDAQGRDGHQTPENRVENITYSDINSMPIGNYTVIVYDYSNHKLFADFIIEIETLNDITILKFNGNGNKKQIAVANISLNSDGVFTIIPGNEINVLESNTISKKVYGIDTNNFHKVNLICLSPNHWDKPIGNKHYFFMLNNCKADNDIRSFHNENLIPELLNHRKVMEVLGVTNMIKPNGKQLSGLGFNSTIKDELIVKIQGSHKRMLKVKF